jgi:flagellar hook-associated protein 2
MSDSLPTINFGGIASGLDTNTIVSQLMSIERRPQVRLAQQQAVEEARSNALKDVKTRLSNLQTAALALKDAAAWADVQTVESSDAAHVGVTRTGGAAPGGYSVRVDALARAQQLTQAGSLATAAADDVLHLSIGGGAAVDVEVKAGDSLQAIADRINGAAGAPAYANVVAGKLVLSGKQTGAANTLSVTSDGSLAADLGMAETQSPLNADFTVNGTRYTDRASNLVVDVLPGLTLSLKGPTASDATVTVGAPAANTDAIKTKVQAFVDQYNSTIEFIRAKLAEKKVPNATNADDRAKGVLAGDRGLATVLAGLRSAISDPVAGAAAGLDRMSQAGVSTGSASATVNADSVAGKLTLDADKLSGLLATRFTDVKRLFTSSAAADYATQGLAQRLDGILRPQLQGTTGADGVVHAGVLDSRISSETTQIELLKRQQADMTTRLALKEKQLRAQFTAMETALSKAQSQGQWLGAQLSGLSASR